MSSIIALWLLGCTSTEEVAPEPEQEQEAPAPEPEPEPEPAPEPPKTVDAVNTDQAMLAGQSVTLEGFYASMTKVAEPPSLDLKLTMDAEMKAGSVICSIADAAKEPEIAAIAAGTKITVKGTVAAAKSGDSSKLDACEIVPVEPPAPAEGKLGKGGKGKTGKKAGKNKAH